jgi:HEAT repeat protein
MTRAIGLRAALWIALGLLATGCKRAEKEANPYVVAPPDVSAQIHALGEDALTADDAAEQLEQMGPTVIPALAAALAREPKDVRQKAVEVLEQVGTPAAVPPLLAAAEHDADDEVRSDALRALGTIGDPRGLPLVEAALGDPKLLIRGAAITGCAGLCTSPQAIGRLAEIAIHDESPAAAQAARATLAAIRNKGPAEEHAVRAAIEARRPASLPTTASADERTQAALLASVIDGQAAVPALAAAVPTASPAVQRQAAFALGNLGDGTSVASLRALLASPDPNVQAYAYDALRGLKERGVDGADAVLAAYAGPKPSRRLGPPEF